MLNISVKAGHLQINKALTYKQSRSSWLMISYSGVYLTPHVIYNYPYQCNFNIKKGENLHTFYPCFLPNIKSKQKNHVNLYHENLYPEKLCIPNL